MNIVVPEKLSEITLKQYMDFSAANKEETESDFLVHRIINIFCGVDMRDCLKMELQDAEDIAQEIAEVLNQTTKLQSTFEHKGIKWGFIPNLSKISLGEYVDLEEYLKDTKTLHKAMAVLYRPITKEYKHIYDIESYEGASKYSEKLKDMPCDVATSATLFFYNLGSELATDSQVYLNILKQTKEKSTTLEKDSSQKNMDGSLQYMHWLRETLQSLIK